MALKYQDMKTQGFWTQAVLVDEDGIVLGHVWGQGGRQISDPFNNFVWENYGTGEEGVCKTRREVKRALRDSVKGNK